MPALCPHCGCSLEADKPVARDGWTIDPRGRVGYRGAAYEIRLTWASILYALAASEDRVRPDALLNRVSDSENINVISVHICKLRKWLRARGLPDPIDSAIGRGHTGYLWNAPAAASGERA